MWFYKQLICPVADQLHNLIMDFYNERACDELENIPWDASVSLGYKQYIAYMSYGRSCSMLLCM